MECPPGQLVREVTLPIDSHFTPRMENQLKAAMQINPNGFPPAFTLLRVPLTGLMMINERCSAPLHQALTQSRKNCCFSLFFFGKKGEKKIADGKAVVTPGVLLGYLHTGLSAGCLESGAIHTARGTSLPASCLLFLHCKDFASLNFPFLRDS